MELKDYIKIGIDQTGGTTKGLAKVLKLEKQDTVVTDAKAHRRGLPSYACIILADVIEASRIEVIAASALVTEKNPEKRAVWKQIIEMETAPPKGSRKDWWAHQDLNLGPTDYESAALTN